MSPTPSLHQNSENENDWFRIRGYPHFGLPIEPKDKEWVCKFVRNPSYVSKHSFFPFLHRTITQRKFRREITEDGTKGKERVGSEKKREIFYASHLDSSVYAYYSHLLSQKYEKILLEKNLSSCVTAYRKIPKIGQSRNCCSVDFAEDVFEYIRSSKEDELIAITFDIKSFFDRLDHKMLKKVWRSVLNLPTLPPDHFQVFKNITSFSYCDEKQVFNEFKNEIVTRSSHGAFVKKPVRRRQDLKSKRAVAYCEGGEFRNRIVTKGLVLRKLVEGAVPKFGIPQGSPISSTLANIYLLDFDFVLNEICRSISGLYRRYSDDIVVVCKPEHKASILKLVVEKIKEFKLEIQKQKTQEFDFVRKNGRLNCFRMMGGKLSSNYRFEYLGFEFDGETSFLKSASLSRFHRSMKRALKRASFFSKNTNILENRGVVFRRRLYKRFSYLGGTRRRLYVRDEDDSSRFNCSHKYDWGNYLTYANLADRTMKNCRAKSQLRKHWAILNKNIFKIESATRSNPSPAEPVPGSESI